jgi:quinol-cytochrome oxidoreductase complex cytochrome b subunit
MTDVKISNENDSIPFYPDHVSTEFRVVVGIVVIAIIVGAIGLFLPVGLGVPADPMDTPAHVKPEWYFLAFYQILKYIPKTTGVLLLIIGVLGLIMLPFIDRKPDKSKKAYRIRFALVAVGLIIAIALSLLGEVS